MSGTAKSTPGTLMASLNGERLNANKHIILSVLLNSLFLTVVLCVVSLQSQIKTQL